MIKPNLHIKIQPKSLWEEFKNFAFKGNLIDLAVAVVIGAAFGAVVNSLVKDIVMPSISYLMPANLNYVDWKLGNNPKKPILIGVFIGEIINFLIIALTVFIIMVKFLGALMKKTIAKPAAPADPTTKECPMCLMTIPIKASKCGHCTSDLPMVTTTAA
jgi:large conductance mechanosensitive channel